MKSIHRVVNLTPHAVVVITAGPPGGEHPEITYQPEPVAARVDQISTPWTVIEPGVGVDVPTYGEVRHLPDPEPGTVFIVSQIVAQAAVGRDDLVYPDSGPTAVRVDGQVRAVRRLLRWPHPASSALQPSDQQGIAIAWVRAMRALRADSLRGPVWDGEHRGIYADPNDPVELQALGPHGPVGSIVVETEQCALAPGLVCWREVESAWIASGGKIEPGGPWTPRPGERIRGWYAGGEVRGVALDVSSAARRCRMTPDEIMRAAPGLAGPDEIVAVLGPAATAWSGTGLPTVVPLRLVSHLTSG